MPSYFSRSCGGASGTGIECVFGVEVVEGGEIVSGFFLRIY